MHVLIGSRGSPLLQPLVVTVALNETAQFSCISPAGVTRWYIYDSGSTAPFVWPYDANALQSFGIRVNSSAFPVELLVKGLSANNETRLMCIDGSGAGSETAVLQIYGKAAKYLIGLSIDRCKVKFIGCVLQQSLLHQRTYVRRRLGTDGLRLLGTHRLFRMG